MNKTEILQKIKYFETKYQRLDDELEKIKKKVADIDISTVQIIQNIASLKQQIEPMVFKEKKEEDFQEILNK